MGRIMPFAPRVLHGYPGTVEALDPAETLLLHGLRGWLADLRQSRDPLPRLGGSMAAAGIPPAAASLDMLMRVLARTARRPVQIGCPQCPRLTADEQRLLHAARLAQGGETGLAAEVLQDGFLSGIGAGFALGPLQGLGALFLAAGLALRPRLLAGLAGPDPAGAAPWPLSLSTRH
ncbi:hypothetical protein [Paracraurococcus lichenis]|uniref:Uncharacterized protein n=1 Tax=Paracraurococcus lichenis TaxID=3064888 RepID=A0ABT9EDF3_9PROT|nr:hypothetical protein [Paracraurococcus sp. LOR1-02]MDO9714243.1 hypothetical protein [Paracraurococcus sp. LOR1-02]